MDFQITRDDALHHAHILLCEQDANTRFPRDSASFSPISSTRRPNPFRRFAEQLNFWLADQRACNRQLLLFAAAHRTGLLLESGAPHRKIRDDLLEHFKCARPIALRADLQVFSRC
jgi:hypothetical protein